jgi:hypothetical protein
VGVVGRHFEDPLGHECNQCKRLAIYWSRSRVFASALARIDPLLLAKNGPRQEHDPDRCVASPYRPRIEPYLAFFSFRATD